MAHIDWRGLFPFHIWQRGLNYYQDGHILNIRRIGTRFFADIEGTEVYRVSVTLHSETDEIEAYSCDCPYGEDGTPCKHLAALLCALEEDADVEESDESLTAQKSLDLAVSEAVNALSPEQMRTLLIQFAQKDSLLREKILLFSARSVPESQSEQWAMDLRDIADAAADRHGFIDYAEAYGFCCSLMAYQRERFPNLMKCGLIMDAFRLVCLVFQTGTEQDIDDSDGGLTLLADDCSEYWNILLESASCEQQKEMLCWFCGIWEENDLGRMFIEDYLFEAPWNSEIAPDILRLLDQEIQNCLEDLRLAYRLEHLVVYRLRWMEKAGDTQATVDSYLKKNHRLSAVREIEIDRAEQNQDWDTAIALLEESKLLDADKPGRISQYCEQLIGIYETLGDAGALRRELEHYVFTSRQDSLTYTAKLKAILPAEEWPKMREQLLESRSMRYLTYPLLEQEGMYAEMMERIEETEEFHALEQYEDTLKQIYPQRCMQVYGKHLCEAMARAGNRKAYWSVIQTLRKLLKYPDGKAAAQAIAGQWKLAYPRRSSMLDELKKAGF